MPSDKESLERQAYWGARIRERRLGRRLSKYRLARMARISLPYLGNLEEGQHSPSDNVRERLAEALGTTPEELFRRPAGQSGRAAS